eukprot:NODE_9827_length_562_cov_17.660592_g9188_i0.p1 GENE.NODE_9827_length_562_cov_17.660592_g9188_i0~~NODE_9827_length_562_cov_17.660592_g9188_i0.p1  ORF type:complete len:126 (+),score=11.26 NODE_9827_length_562_cov_17.660592_g9188_i0:134-511(+)
MEGCGFGGKGCGVGTTGVGTGAGIGTFSSCVSLFSVFSSESTSSETDWELALRGTCFEIGISIVCLFFVNFHIFLIVTVTYFDMSFSYKIQYHITNCPLHVNELNAQSFADPGAIVVMYLIQVIY